MNNIELETKIKEIVAKENMFDMILAAKDFEKEYKTSDFYKITKISLMDILKDAKMFYSFSANAIKEKLQMIINSIDLNSLNQLFDQVAEVYSKENADTTAIIDSLKDFKSLVK